MSQQHGHLRISARISALVSCLAAPVWAGATDDGLEGHGDFSRHCAGRTGAERGESWLIWWQQGGHTGYV